MITELVLIAALGSAGGSAPEPSRPADAAPAAAMPRMGQAVLTRALPRYPGALDDVVPVGDTLEAKGVPMNVQSFMTNDPPRKVLDFYEDYFKKQGLRMLGNGDMVIPFPYPSVTAMDEQNDIDISVITVPSPDRRTMVLLARADMRPLLSNLDGLEAKRYGGLPPYPHGNAPSAVVFKDGEVQNTQVSFDTTDSPAQVTAFYQKTFGSPGAQDGTDGTVSFRVADGVWRISTNYYPSLSKTVVVAIHADAPRAPAAEGP